MGLNIFHRSKSSRKFESDTAHREEKKTKDKSNAGVYPIDDETLELLELKGQGLEELSPDAGLGNGLKIRRIMQIVNDLAKKDMNKMRILDLACARGLYSIETALMDATVKGLDARMEWMGKGVEADKRLGLNNLQFEQNDIRNLTLASHGTYDIIYFMGVLYRLDVPDSFGVIDNLSQMCSQYMIIDTHVCHTPQSKAEYKGQSYEGIKSREHGDDDPTDVRESRFVKSIDNTFAFIFTKESLLRLLHDVGFTSIYECYTPFDPFKPNDRITLVASKGNPVKLSTYPWLNDINEEQIDQTLSQKYGRNLSVKPRSLKLRLGDVVNKVLRCVGFEIRPIHVDQSVKYIAS